MASKALLSVLMIVLLGISSVHAASTAFLPTLISDTSDGYIVYRYDLPDVNGNTDFTVTGCSEDFTVSINPYLSNFYLVNGTVASTNSSTATDSYSESIDTNYATTWEVSISGCENPSVLVNGTVCSVGTVGPACVAPQTTNNFDLNNQVVVYRLPLISTTSTYSVDVRLIADVPSGNTLQVSDVFYNEIPENIVFGQSFTANVTNSTVATIEDPMVLAGYYYIAFQSDSAINGITVSISTQDCTNPNATQFWNANTEECEDIAVLSTQYNFTTFEFKSSYMFDDDDTFVYFQLLVGGSLQMGVAPADDDGDGTVPDVYLKYGTIPTADDYDFMASSGVDTLFYDSGSIAAGLWYMGLTTTDNKDLNDDFILWFKTNCPNECNDLGTCSGAHSCECTDNWTGFACNLYVPNGQDPDDVEGSYDWWDVSEWGAPAWIAVSLLVVLFVVVFVLLALLGFVSFKWRQERSRYKSY